MDFREMQVIKGKDGKLYLCANCVDGGNLKHYVIAVLTDEERKPKNVDYDESMGGASGGVLIF